MKGRTTIIIAHRLSTIKNASQIVVLQHGEKVEEGTHDELLARAGVFRRLYDIQFGSRPAAHVAAVAEHHTSPATTGEWGSEGAR
jgi:ABC-type multidrug transport system ATPase subunit